MIVLIENYRGIDISFNSEIEQFSYSVDTISWGEKQSFAACKKSIDDYIKANAEFEPFYVRSKRYGNCIKIIGIRKDNRFVYESKGKKEQLSEYNEVDYIEYKEEQEPQYAKIAVLEIEIDKIRKEIEEVRNTIIGKSLSEIKEKYLVA